ncbi:hypothetical protein OCF66_17040 [Bacillus toyonensis]|uniref:hypothetical protein n=1 Tax=Bacillus toyonensis TaxID=155322 RepID=UPI0021CDFBBD|nr:hypothetical protein [Bacillus toyonensis]MCU5726671.1 hypothetical protein [Bacillus toyonensis]
MSKLIINKLLIIDVETKKAKSVKFKDGVNIITSSDNQVGKSTIMKSLYYSMGAEVFFSERFQVKTKVHIVDFSVDKDTYTCIRYNDIVVIQKNQNQTVKCTSATQLAEVLMGIFGFGVFIENKKNEFVLAPPVYYYTPYYIDQDYGWTKDINSFDKLGQFNKDKREKIYYYHLGILNDNYSKCLSEKEKLTVQINCFKKKQSEITALLQYIKNNITSIDMTINLESIEVQKQELLKKYKKYSFDLDNVRREILEYQEEIFKIDNIIANLESTVKENNNIKKHLKHEFDIECPYCKRTFEVQTKDILKINYNIEDLQKTKLEMLSMKEKISEKLGSLQKKFLSFKEQLISIENETLDVENTFDDVLKYKGIQETQKRLNIDLVENNLELINSEEKLKPIKKSLTAWSKKIKAADEKYKEALKVNLLKFNTKENTLPKKVNVGTGIIASGSGQIRVNLARVYSFLEVMEEYNTEGLKFPLVIDSPKGGEQSQSNSELIIELITQIKDIENQIILATIDFDSFYKGDLSSFNKIVLENTEYNLLSNEEYTKNKRDIDNGLETFFKVNGL